AGNGNNLLGGAQDNGCLGYSGSQSWIEYAPTGDGGWTGFDPSNPSKVYCAIQHLTYYDSSDKKSWSRTSIPDRLSKVSFFAPLALDPNTPGTIYMGSVGVWKSTDFGLHWNE